MALTLVILAAGVGTRFGGPKQLTPIGPSGETLFDYAIYDAARAGFARAVLVLRPDLLESARAHVAQVIGQAIPVGYAEQPSDEKRVKPWGTGHAVLAARDLVDGPFAVCNADDFYGPGAYRLLAEHLTHAPTHAPTHALVAYRLDTTLSPHGGVARAVARCGPHGLLERLEEVRDVRRTPVGLVGVTPSGERRTLTGTEPVSMNLWGFRPHVLPVLHEQFEAFRAAAARSPDAEFLLSSAINAQVASGRASLRVLTAPDRWLGISFADDMPSARAALAELVGAGRYPADLRAAFARL